MLPLLTKVRDFLLVAERNSYVSEGSVLAALYKAVPSFLPVLLTPCAETRPTSRKTARKQKIKNERGDIQRKGKEEEEGKKKRVSA